MSQTEVDNRLHRIANILLLNASFSHNIGLLNGKMGVAVFFFHYGYYTGNEIYTEFAGELIDEIYEEIHQNTPINYADGLAGFGTAIEYLVQQGFMEADTDEVLAELDKQIHHHIIHHAPQSLDMCYGICGLGKYLTARLAHTAGTKETASDLLNKQHLALIVERIDCSYDNAPLSDLLSIIQFLSDVIFYGASSEKARNCLDRAIGKLEGKALELAPTDEDLSLFDPLCAAVVLIQASENTGIQDYSDLAVRFLKHFEPDFRIHTNKSALHSSVDALKYSLAYHYLGDRLDNDICKEQCTKWLSKALEEEKESLAGFLLGHSTDFSIGTLRCSPEGLLTGYAGGGLILLTLAGGCSTHWMRLVPIHTLMNDL